MWDNRSFKGAGDKKNLECLGKTSLKKRFRCTSWQILVERISQ